jgi:hypothetical protein
LWDVAAGSVLATFTADGNLRGVRFTPDGRCLAGDALGRVHLLAPFL